MKKINLIMIVLLLFLTGCSSLKLSKNEDNYRLNKINRFYRQWKGVPYAYGGYSKRGIDCSGLVKIFYDKEFNIILPRTTKSMSKIGEEISDREDWSAGDLIFFKTGWRTRHVGIYMSNNKFMHASTRKGVMISKVQGYWEDKFWQVRRVKK